MKYRRVLNNNSAVAGVIEALLLVALVAVILSMIQLVYIPQIMKEKEADHMDEVSNQFSNLKSVIEIQSMMGVMDPGETLTSTPMSSPITLGSKELPYFISARSYGEIDIVDKDTAGDYKINIQPAPAAFPSGIPLTSLKYEAFNSEFVDQMYILEGGGIIVKQPEGEVMRVYPSMTTENHSDEGFIKINYFIPLFNSIPGKMNFGGFNYYDDCYVYTNYTNYYSHSGNANFIYIYTDYPEAWKNSLVNTTDLRGLLLEYYENGYINVELDKTVTPNRVEITPLSKTITIDLTIAEIGIQVGPGYVV